MINDASLIKVRLMMHQIPGAMHLLTPGGAGRWGRCHFAINPPPDTECDFGVVLYNALPADRFICAPENTLFIAGEPASKKVYPQKFYRQFYHVVDTHARSRHPRVQLDALGLCWHIGLDRETWEFRYGYDHLSALNYPEKGNRVSVICSDAAFTPGQRLRLQFLRQLKDRLGDQLVHFGRGFEPIRDKMEAIIPHRFHLVLENCEETNYWTEKLADAYLGWAFPLYVGCPNLESFFDARSFIKLNPNQVNEAARKIETLLATPANAAEQTLIQEARRRVLDIYNPFAWTARWVEEYFQPAAKHALTIRSHKAFRRFPQGLSYRLRHWR